MGKSFDPNTGKVTGSTSKTIAMPGFKESELLIPNKNLVGPAGQTIAHVIQSDPHKEIKEIIEYNRGCFTSTREKGMILLGNTLIVRLFKYIPYNFRAGSTFKNPLLAPYQTEGGKTAMRESPFQFTFRAVVKMVGDQCSDNFKQLVKEGTVVDIKTGINMQNHACALTEDEMYHSKAQDFDGHFLINENMIEKIVGNFDFEEYFKTDF